MSENPKLGFIGAGNMATALIRGILHARCTTPSQILVADIDAAKTAALASAHGVQAAANNCEVVRQCDAVVLAVKPQTMSAVLAEIAPGVRPDQCFISIAAGVTLARLEATLGPQARVIRVMPNTPSLIGAGAAGIAPGTRATDADIALARRLFEAVGIAVVLDEKHLDAVTAVSGSGPAYVFFFVESLLEAAEYAGLERAVAEALVKQTILGAARMIVETGQPPAKLREAVTSPGGTTAAALTVLREKNFTELIVQAVQAAVARSVQLGKG